jgi:hypothetical protein
MNRVHVDPSCIMQRSSGVREALAPVMPPMLLVLRLAPKMLQLRLHVTDFRHSLFFCQGVSEVDPR